jgi:hypothetical protein
MSVTVTPFDFYPPDGVNPRPPLDHAPRTHEERLTYKARGWLPGRFEVEVDVDRGRLGATVFPERSVGAQLEAEDIVDPHLVEEIREEITMWFAPGRRTVKLFREVRKANPAYSVVTSPDEPPEIVTYEDLELHETVDLVDSTLVGQNEPPYIFRRMGTLVRNTFDENDQPIFVEFNSAGLQTELSRLAKWVDAKMSRSGAVAFPVVDPPAKETGVVLSNPPRRVPVAVGLIQAPVLRPDGTLFDVEGYDPATRLLYQRPPGMNPTIYASTEDALAVIREMVQDFPFDSDASFASYLAWLLTPALRPMIGAAPTPLALFEAPTQGTGKDLLASTVYLIYHGTPPPPRPLPADEEEVRKEIVSALMAGRTMLLYTNVSGVLRSDALAGLVTSTRWSGRRLGHSQDLSFAVELSVGITANNLAFGADWPRRIYKVRIDANRPDPWNRTFVHTDLPTWVLTHRNELLGAVYYLCTSWAEASGGRAEPIEWSSYTRWASVIGSVLKHAGVEGFLDNSAVVASDANDEVWANVFETWRERFGAEWVTTSQLEGLSANSNFWPEEILTSAGALPENVAQRLGKNLQSRIGAMTGDGLRLERHPTARRPAKWRLV